MIYKKDFLLSNFDGNPEKTIKKIIWLNDDDTNKLITIEKLNGDKMQLLCESCISNYKYVQIYKYGHYHHINENYYVEI